MAGYLEVAEARERGGLRLVLSAGVPGPWGEGAKGLFDLKGVPYWKVRQQPGGENAELVAWTGESNAPQAVYEGEPARSSWTSIVLLAERLAPEPPLLPADPEARAWLFGLGFAVCGEQGFGWQRRLMMLDEVLSLPEDVLGPTHPVRRLVRRMGERYGYSPRAARAAPARAAGVLELLARRLEAQRRRGSPYFLGDRVSAVDVYWAAFAAMLRPLPEAVCPMPAAMRSQYTAQHPLLERAARPILLEHRDFMYERHLRLPLDL